jgi:D-alanine-D-alanine ligase
LTVPTELTPYGETVDPYQVELIGAALQIAGFSVQSRHYHPATATADIARARPDVILNMAYGFSSPREGFHEEQPEIAMRLETLGWNAVGSSAAVQRLAQDKLETARALEPLGVLAPLPLDPDKWPADVPFAVLKPRRGACHRGVRVVTREERHRLPDGIGSEWLLQRYVDGPEYTVSVLEAPDCDELLIFPPLRIDFRGKDTSPAIMSEIRSDWVVTIDRARHATFAEVSRRIFRGLGLRDYARLDFRLGPDGPVLLDANALPGMNPTHGLFAMSAAAAGVDYHALIWKLVGRALQRCRR